MLFLFEGVAIIPGEETTVLLKRVGLMNWMHCLMMCRDMDHNKHCQLYVLNINFYFYIYLGSIKSTQGAQNSEIGRMVETIGR